MYIYNTFIVLFSKMTNLALRIVFCALVCAVFTHASCPPRCECSEAAQTVKCVSKDLRSIPSGIPGYTRNLFITGNQISRIGPESFKGLDNITTLSLSNNRYGKICCYPINEYVYSTEILTI